MHPFSDKNSSLDQLFLFLIQVSGTAVPGILLYGRVRFDGVCSIFKMCTYSSSTGVMQIN